MQLYRVNNVCHYEHTRRSIGRRLCAFINVKRVKNLSIARVYLIRSHKTRDRFQMGEARKNHSRMANAVLKRACFPSSLHFHFELRVRTFDTIVTRGYFGVMCEPSRCYVCLWSVTVLITNLSQKKKHEKQKTKWWIKRHCSYVNYPWCIFIGENRQHLSSVVWPSIW